MSCSPSPFPINLYTYNSPRRYLEDFPLDRWVIPPEQAQEAYGQLVERSRWRSLGIRIYGSRNAPGSMIGSTPPFHSSNVQTMHLQRAQSTDQARHIGHSVFGHRQPSMPQQLPQRHTGHQVPHGLPHTAVPSHTSNRMPPPPSNVLRSQPHGQPVPTYPNGMPVYSPTGQGSPGGVPPTATNTAVPHSGHMYGPPSHQVLQGMPSNKGQVYTFDNTLFNVIDKQYRKAREKKNETPPVEPPAPPPPTPPYEKRQKPTERKAVTKSGRRNMRRQAEAEIFPWNRTLDFKAARTNATWDDSIYDKSTLTEMAATRARNEPVIERIDGEENERQRE